ncbi:hypothetical protein SSS_06309 [Sarcoptes scabiei]|uniref:UMA domain-containing protein n=1 Tax=Sarcoptes scabiei TaxID=52283 RepID=A0A834VBT0_SARSC|nr:hypothetical protein SSS_06309 [Sarcoptes scabiei]
MLDSLFGFGKSKKSKNSNGGGNNQGDDQSPNDDGNYVFVNNNNDPNRPPYPQTMMLNDDLIRGGPNSFYPSLDPSARSSGGNNPSANTNCRQCSPIDNVPFSINNSGGGPGGSFDDSEDYNIISTLNRIESFAESSKYGFDLENSIMQESYKD